MAGGGGKRGRGDVAAIGPHSSPSEVREWLATFLTAEQLKSVTDALDEHGNEQLDGEVLLSVSDADLREGLHISSFCVRRKIMLHIDALRGGSGGQNSGTHGAGPSGAQHGAPGAAAAAQFCAATGAALQSASDNLHKTLLQGGDAEEAAAARQQLLSSLLRAANFTRDMVVPYGAPMLAGTCSEDAAEASGVPNTPDMEAAALGLQLAGSVGATVDSGQHRAVSTGERCGGIGRGGPNKPKTCQRCRIAGLGVVPLAGGHQCPYKSFSLDQVRALVKQAAAQMQAPPGGPPGVAPAAAPPAQPQAPPAHDAQGMQAGPVAVPMVPADGGEGQPPQ